MTAAAHRSHPLGLYLEVQALMTGCLFPPNLWLEVLALEGPRLVSCLIWTLFPSSHILPLQSPCAHPPPAIEFGVGINLYLSPWGLFHVFFTTPVCYM